MYIIAKWLINTMALLGTAYLIPGISVSGFYIALIVSVLLGLLNVTFKPILVILTLPINVLTLGLFTFIINGFLLWFVSTFVKGFSVSGFWIAVLGALIISVFSWAGNQFIKRDNTQDGTR